MGCSAGYHVLQQESGVGEGILTVPLVVVKWVVLRDVTLYFIVRV